MNLARQIQIGESQFINIDDTALLPKKYMYVEPTKLDKLKAMHSSKNNVIDPYILFLNISNYPNIFKDEIQLINELNKKLDKLIVKLFKELSI